MDITLHRADRIIAEANRAGGSTWLDLILKDVDGREHSITLFFDEPNQAKALAYARAINAINKAAAEKEPA